jgi:hypothetical protein
MLIFIYTVSYIWVLLLSQFCRKINTQLMWICNFLIMYLVGKSEMKRSLRRPKRIRKDNIKMDLRNIVWKCELDQPSSDTDQ